MLFRIPGTMPICRADQPVDADRLGMLQEISFIEALDTAPAAVVCLTLNCPELLPATGLT